MQQAVVHGKGLSAFKYMKLFVTDSGPKGHYLWQSKTLFPAIFDPRLSIVKSINDCRLSGVVILTCPLASSDPSLFGHLHNNRDGMPYLLSSVLAPFLVVILDDYT